MKRFARWSFAFLGLLILGSSSLAAEVQIPFSRQVALSPGEYTLRFSLWDAETAGQRLWSETKDIQIGDDKLLSTKLGDVTDPSQHSGALGDLDFSKVLWVSVEDMGAGDSPRMLGARTTVVPASGLLTNAAGGAKDTQGTETRAGGAPASNSALANTETRGQPSTPQAQAPKTQDTSGNPEMAKDASQPASSANALFAQPQGTALGEKVAAASLLDRAWNSIKSLFGGSRSRTSSNKKSNTNTNSNTTTYATHGQATRDLLKDFHPWKTGSVKINPSWESDLDAFAKAGPTHIIIADMPAVADHMLASGFQGRWTALHYALSRSYAGFNWSGGTDSDGIWLKSHETEIIEFWQNYIDAIIRVMNKHSNMTALIIYKDGFDLLGRTLGNSTLKAFPDNLKSRVTLGETVPD